MKLPHLPLSLLALSSPHNNNNANIHNKPSLLIPAGTLTKPPSPSEPAMLCYDHRYATLAPQIDDCVTIIADVLSPPQIDIYKPQIFSRHPFGIQKPLPSRWTTERRECVVVVDIPPNLPGRKALEVGEASMLDIKTAAFELLKKCVVDGEHLGGITTTGRDWNLQVRLEAEGMDEGFSKGRGVN